MALLPELDERSVLHVVDENFERVELKTYAIRMLYIGEHTLAKEEVTELFRGSVNDVNCSYCDINVTGLLLVYDSYFVHIIEGSEDTVHRQLRFLFKMEQDYIERLTKEDDNTPALTDGGTEGLASLEEPEKSERKIFKRLKMLIVYHSIKKLIFNDWRSVSARPPTLVSRLDVFGSMADHMEHLKVCLDKIDKLCQLATTGEELTFDGLSAVDPKMDALPEAALLDFLLQSQYVLDLRYVFHLHRRVDDYSFYFEDVWPIPNHFTPRLLYKLKIDDSFVEPLPVMPWELVKKETEDEEGRDEKESASDSSD